MASLDLIAASYQSRFQWDEYNVHNSFDALYRHYVKKYKQDIVDSIALGIALETLLDGGAVDIENMPDNVKIAFEQAFPNIPIDTINERSTDELEYLVNAWKGKLFEVEVQDQLNAGMRVGKWQLESGQHAELAESATQPGWDLKIIDEDDRIVDTFQLKSTDSASYINHALERYPDVPIVATSDLANHASESVSVANLSNQDVTSQVDDVINDSDVLTDTFLQSTPAVVIAAMEWIQVRSGKKTAAQAIESAGERIGLSLVAGVIGAGAAAIVGPIGIFLELQLDIC